MKPVDQTLFGGEVGNCLAACVASIFEIELDKVPNFAAAGDRWGEALAEWASERGWVPLLLHFEQESARPATERLAEMFPGVYSIVSGPAERGLLHATVWRGGAIEHDPHPSRAGLLSIHDVIVFVPLCPGVKPAPASRTRCSRCNGANVEQQWWVNPNTRELIEPAGDHEEAQYGMTWCHDCDAHVELVVDAAAGGVS